MFVGAAGPVRAANSAKGGSWKAAHNGTAGSAFEPGASGLPYYCAPPVTDLAVMFASCVATKPLKKSRRKFGFILTHRKTNRKAIQHNTIRKLHV